MDNQLNVGQVVLSTKGRDAGRYFVIVEVASGGYVRIADGEVRRIANPKLKKGKHVVWEGEVLDGIAEKILAGKQVFDSELKSALRKYNQNQR